MEKEDDHPLANWLGREKTPTGPTGKPVYEAFKPVDRRQLRVQVCPRGPVWEWLPYLGLQRIVTDADHGTRLALLWSFAVVIIEGRNLQPLARALAQERCDAVRAFDPDQFDPSPDKAAPFIEKIQIHVQDTLAAVEASFPPFPRENQKAGRQQ